MSIANNEDYKPFSLKLPDGSTREFLHPLTGADLAEKISMTLGKAAIGIKINGSVRDLSTELSENSDVEIITRKSPDALELIRHSCAHIMAEAVQTLYPGTQVTIGPNIENGFYYDFVRDTPFTIQDFAAIEKKMAEIIARNSKITRRVMPRETAIELFDKRGESYKVEIIKDLPEDAEISVYNQDGWEDLCRGPHMPSTGAVGTAFKIMRVSGAYWRGDQKNAVLQRIYATAWRDKEELDAHLTMLEEAEKRDHRKLGKELGLYHFQEEAVGSVFWHPKGWTLYRVLENYVRRQIEAAGYVEVHTPQLYSSSLFKASGHWDMYGDNMFKVPVRGDAADEDVQVLAIKPMSCPGHIQIFNQGIKSYRDLPLRVAEFGNCHRNEAHGALHGLIRVRQMVQDDAHIFCTEEQIQSESIGVCNMIRSTYKDLGFEISRVRLADRPPVRAGSDETWDKAEGSLHKALVEAGFEYDINKGDGAFYGPKIEFYLKDAIGREWQCGTLQVDLVLPERLDANYIGEDGQKHRPVMLHRAILGSFHRFIGILIEDTAGRLPLWLAPVQTVVCPISNQFDEYARKVANAMRAQGLRAEVDLSAEKINAKIREHSLKRVPAILVVGKKEEEEGTVALRRLGGDAQEILPLDTAAKLLQEEASPPDLR